MARILLTCGDENWCLCHTRVQQSAHCMAQSSRSVQIDESWFATCLGITVCHGYDRCFLKTQNVAQTRILGESVHQRHLSRSGIAKYVLDAFRLKSVEKKARAIFLGVVPLV